MKVNYNIKHPLIPYESLHYVNCLQNYLREQPDNIKSVNLICETSKFLSLIYSSINPHTVDLTVELFNTLVEFCSVSPSYTWYWQFRM